VNDHIHGPEQARLPKPLPIKISAECYLDKGDCPVPDSCACSCHFRQGLSEKEENA